jgi:hypothetical protein
LTISVTRISDNVEVAKGELYYEDLDGYISRYFGTGCSLDCGSDRLVFIDDGKLYRFTADYTHTNGAIAADFRDTYLAPYGFNYLRPAKTQLPFDTKQYTSVIESGNQTWTVKSLGKFDGVALGYLRGDTVSVAFKDSLGATVSTVSGKTINGSIDANIEDERISDIIYAGEFIEADGTIEITIAGTETEIGIIFPTASIDVGMTNLSFSHAVKNFDRQEVSAISGYVDFIKGNRVLDHKGSFDIEMLDYDKMVLLNKKLSQELIAMDGSDTTGNEAADGISRFASTKIIGRIRSLTMKSEIKDGDIKDIVPVGFEIREIV